jgi:hypothetical protein
MQEIVRLASALKLVFLYAIMHTGNAIPGLPQSTFGSKVYQTLNTYF